MTAFRIFRRLSELLDVNASSPADQDVLAYDAGSGEWVNSASGGGGGVSKLIDLTDVAGTDGAGKAPVSDGADTFTLTDIATQAELNSAISALSGTYQPLDSDLTAIAALSTTSFGRALLALADAAALRSVAGLGTAALAATGDFDAAGAAAAAQAASQPLDSDLTAIAALATTAFGRSLLALADAAALRTTGGLVIGTDVEAHDSDLTTIAGLSPTNDDVLQRKAGAWTNRTLAQLISDLAALGTTFQPLDSDLTSIAALSTTSFGRGLLALANAAALRTSAGLVIGTDVEAHDADLTTIAGLDSSTSGAIASDGSGWIKKTYAQFKTALSLVSSDVGLGSVTNDAQLKAADLDTDGTLAANSDTKIASQKATKTFANTKVGSVAATDGSIVVAGTATAPTIATGTLDAIAAAHAPAANWSNNSKKITSVANGVSAQDAATVAQLGVVDRASGTSTSGTPGTSIASITAAAGNQLVAWTVFCTQTNAAGTQTTVTVTYTDSTTTTITSAAANAATILGNAGALITAGTLTAGSTKEVSSIAVTTAGVGTGTRNGAIAAMEVPQ